MAKRDAQQRESIQGPGIKQRLTRDPKSFFGALALVAIGAGIAIVVGSFGGHRLGTHGMDEDDMGHTNRGPMLVMGGMSRGGHEWTDPDAAMGTVVVGTVAAVTDANLTLTSDDGSSATYTIDGDTKIFAEGGASSTTIIVGSRINAYVSVTDGTLLTGVLILK